MNNSIDYAQYCRDTGDSKDSPLLRKTIDVGKGIEVFALSGYEKETGRYLLSQTNAAETAGKTAQYISNFVGSRSPQALPWKGFVFQTFSVENSNKPIIGVPVELATAFWAEQASKGNSSAIALAIAFMVATLERQADIVFGVNRSQESETKRLQELLFGLEAGDYRVHFCAEYYQELHRILPFVRRVKHGRPSLFGKVTREYFYALFPGNVNDIFDERNPNRWYYNHQFLTESGDKVFEQVMISFLTFLRCCRPGDWRNFENQYRNTYGSGFQGDLDI